MNVTKTSVWIALGALFIIPFLVLFVSNGFFFPFITGKNFLFRILVEVALAAWVLVALRDTRYRPQFSYTAVLLAAFTLWMAIADAFAVNAHKAFWSNFERMDGWVTLIHLLAFFVVAGTILTVEKKWDWWWRAFLAAAALESLWGALQLFCVGKACGAQGALFAIHQGSIRVDATLGNAEYLAGFMLFAFAITLWQYFSLTGVAMRWWRYVLIALGLLELVIMYETQTRGTLIGLVGGLIVGGVLVAVENKGKVRTYAAGALIALAVLGGVFYGIRSTPLVQHDGTLSRLASVFDPAQYQVRGTIAHMAVEGALAKPVTGWGQEGFNYVFNKYYDPSLYEQEPWFDRAHDIFFDWLIAGGFPALLLFVGIIASAFYALYRARALSRIERIVLISLLAAYSIEGLTVFDNLFTYIPLIALLAFVHAQNMKPVAQVDALTEVSEQTVLTVAAPIAAVALILVIWFVNIQNMVAASDFITALTPTADDTQNLAGFTKTIGDGSFASQEIAEQLTVFAEQSVSQQSVSSDTKNSLLALALKEMGEEVAHASQDARLHLEYSSLYRVTGNNDGSNAELEKAHELAPSKQTIIIQQGAMAFQAGNAKDAKKYFDQAYALDPIFPDVATYAAAGDIAVGQTALAKSILLKSYATTTVPADILILAYYETQDYNNLILLLERKARENPNNATPSYQLAEIYATVGRMTEAKALVQKTVAAHPDTASVGAQLMSQIMAAK